VEIVMSCEGSLSELQARAEPLVERYFTMVYSIAFRILGNPQDAEDATQECFLRLFRDPKRALCARSAEAWVSTVARNTAVSMQRSLLRARRRLERQREESVGGEAAPLEDPIDEQRLFVALADLSEEDRRLIEMRFLEGKSWEGIALEVRKNPGAVGTALCRALKRLRQWYQSGAD
jgi:RNA polymerase sigma-70 factor (ECF subfamily)